MSPGSGSGAIRRTSAQNKLLRSAIEQQKSVIILLGFLLLLFSSFFRGAGGCVLGVTVLRPWLSSFLADYGFQFPQF